MQQTAKVQTVVAAPPVAPPLPFTYIGKMASEGKWEVYLARGERTIIVKPESTIESVYRVESIRPPVLSLTYLPLNQAQNMNIGGAN